MKKLFPILLLLVFGLTACNSTSPYAGKYNGTFTFIKDSKTKSGSVRMMSNPLNQEGLLLYGVLPLDPVSTGSFAANSTNDDFIAQILGTIVGNNSYINAAEEAVKNIKVEADFSGNTVNMVVYYEIEVFSTLQTRVEIIKFTGTK